MQSYLTDGRRTTASRIAAYSSLTSQRQTPTGSKRASFGSPLAPATPENQAELPFYEGHFLSVLFDKLDDMLETSSDENLLMTGILAKLAQHPHDILHAYLFSLPLTTSQFSSACASPASPRKQLKDAPGAAWCVHKSGVRNLSRTLKSVWENARTRAEEIKGFDDHLARVMARMGVRGGGQMEESSGKAAYPYPLDGFLEAYIILEEFLKEIAAILQARDDLQGLRVRLDESVVL